MNATTHHHLIADIIESPEAGPGPHIRLQQQDGCDEPVTILLHPWQLRAVCEQLGPLPASDEAARTIARLSRGLRLLHGRVTELAYHLHHFSDDRHANLSYEQGHAAATATIADALMAELSELPGAASSTQVPPGVAPEPASQAEQ